MKIRNYWLSVALSFLGIAAPALAQTGNTPQACKPEVKQIRDNQVTLVWNNVEPVYGILDDFEGHPDFAINSPGELGWSYWDMDHARTYSIGDYIWQDQSTPKAFQVWTPSKTIPAYTYEKALPHSGKKCLVSLATVTGERRNDWLISPDLRSQNFAEDITLSFWARSFNTASGEELIKIAYSTTTMELDEFLFLNNGAPVIIPESSKEHPGMYFFSFVIPKEARYVAINCVTWEGHALFIDDVALATNKVNPTKAAPNYLTGFNLYRDGVKVNSELITEHSYVDIVPTFGDHDYQVESVFETGSPIKGVATTVNVPNIHLLPFVEDFISYDFETNFWEVSCPDNPIQSISNPCFWSVNYRPYTMFNEAAQFYPLSSLQNYKDYCLTSMELDATGLDSVMMCYDIGLDAYELTGSSRGGEAIAVEVFVDGEWIEVDRRRDTCGDYDYTRFYVDLSQYVAHKKFRIRFNAQGRTASNLIAWYISYIRVYEKAKAKVSGTVLCDGNPVAGVRVTFTSAQQDVYTVVTAADGTYSIPGVDADRYTVTAELTGYNPYSETLTVSKGSQTVDIAMTRPVIALTSTSQAHTLAAEATDNGTIGLQNTGNGTSRVGMWIDYKDKTVSAAPSFETLKTFNTSDILQSSIGFDGEYFYMAQSDEYTNDALIYKYDKEGTFVGTFMPNVHLRRWFAMAYDGENFYSVHADNIIRIINMKEGIQIGEIPTEVTGLCHIAYDEARDAFWVGSLNTLALVDRNGNTLVDEIIYNSEEVLFSGSAYDPYFKEGPCLWIMDRSRGNNPLSVWTKAVIRRIDLTDMELKDDYSFPCDEWPGFIYGGSNYGQVWGAGLFGTTRYKDGHFVLMGVIMAKPGLVGIVDMYEVPNWLKMEEYGFNMEAAGSKQVAYTVDAANLLENDSCKATVTFRMDPYAAPLQFEVSAKVNAKAQYAKPLSLRAVAQNDNAAKLTWSVPQSATAPASYNIYRNGEKIASATTPEYTDNNLKFGDYVYVVSAVYAANNESARSNEAKINIKVGVACYAPFGLTAANVRNNSIALTWKDPSAAGSQATSLRWDNGRTEDGIVAAGEWIGAASWSAQDLVPYRNMGLKSVSLVPMTVNAEFTVKIFENDVMVYSQRAEKAGMKAGSPFTVVLDEEYKINDRKELKVGIECAN
ncbi:MAG: carboxypeptidase regulatory-like domain-containing protein, partial [Bacteroidales bacterium]|nr:carboxypeptidase regulatory-like domain-containing protein [Bacteroidales bacterium]